MDKEKIIKLIDTYWKFDNDQQPTSTWHDKQDLITAIEQLTIPIVVKSVYCDCEPYGRFNSVGVCVECKREYHP